MFCLTDFVQGLSYKGVQDRQVSVVIFFFIYIYIYIKRKEKEKYFIRTFSPKLNSLH